MNETLLKIGDFARLTQTNLRTLHYYEERGLIEPAMRSAGGFRYYRRTDANRVHTIRRLQGLGLTLEEIANLLGTRDPEASREEVLHRVRHALREQDRILAEQIELLQSERQEIEVALEKMTECESCRLTPGADNNFCEPCTQTGKPLPRQLSSLF